MEEATVKTSCKECIFASFESAPEYNIQIGCELGRLQTFLNRDEVRYEINEKEKIEYAVIQRFCNTCRNPQWLEDNPGKDKTIMADTSINYGAVVNMTEAFNFLDMQYVIISLLSQTYKPKAIHIVYDSHDIPRDQHASLRALTEIPITFTKVLNKTPIKTGISLCDNQFFIVVSPGEFVYSQFAYLANEALNTDMERCLVIKSKHGQKLVSRLAYDVLKTDDVDECVKNIQEMNPELVLEV